MQGARAPEPPTARLTETSFQNSLADAERWSHFPGTSAVPSGRLLLVCLGVYVRGGALEVPMPSPAGL